MRGSPSSMDPSPRPALLIGTSSEFIGGKPLPRVMRSRRVLFFLGPDGVGKSTVARLLAGAGHTRLSTREVQDALLERVRSTRWPDVVTRAPAVVLDGPVWLRGREGPVRLLTELAQERAKQGRRTMFCQVDRDGSMEQLIAAMEVGSSAVVGLRFPIGRRARLRCARRLCESLGLPREAAIGSDAIDPWSYDRLVGWLVERTWRQS